MEGMAAVDKLTLDMCMKEYPYISVEGCNSLLSVGATDDQFARSNTASKREIDDRLSSYSLTDYSREATVEDASHVDITVGLTGKSGSGKSATGNMLLNESFFEEVAGTESNAALETSHKSSNDPYLTVVDTPGSWQLATNRMERIHLYALVINLASPRFFRKDLETVRKLKDYNKLIRSKRCFLLLTHASDALRGRSLSDYIAEIKGDPLHELIVTDLEGWRVRAINNNCSTEYESAMQLDMTKKLMRRTSKHANFNESGLRDSLPDCCSACSRTHMIIMGGILVVTILGLLIGFLV